MLELFAKHGGFDLKLKAAGDLDVDQHHTVEDVGIVLGQLFAKALGDRKGINRAGYFVLPMDETLAVVAVDLGGRPALVYKDLVKVRLVGDLQAELVEDFFGGFVNHAGANLHAKVLYGRSNHHKLEAIFKCFARAMKFACSRTRGCKDQLPSTKGCYDRDPRLRRRQSALGGEHAGRDRRASTRWCAMPPGCGARVEDHSARRGPLRPDDARARRAATCARRCVERIRAGVPFLGICLGLQALFDGSEEAPGDARPGLVRGRGAAVPAGCARAAHGLERAGAARPDSRLLRRPRRRARTSTSRTATTCRVTTRDRGHLHLRADLHGGARSRTTSSACSSTRRNPGPLGLRIVQNFVEL